MNNQEVEILKLGNIMPITPISGSRLYDTSQFRNQTIMIVSDGGPIFDHYIYILRKECESSYSFLKTTKSIVGGPFSYRPHMIVNNLRSSGNSLIDTPLVGELDGELVIGMSFAVGNWHSSVVEKIISNNIVITKNSVYAIHSLSEFRNDKLNKLGI